MRLGFRTLTLTYAQVEKESLKVAAFLASQGLSKGDMVLLCAVNCPQWICAYWGCLLHGCPVIPLATQSTPALIQKIVQQTGAKVCIKSAQVSCSLPDVAIVSVEQLFSVTEPYDISNYQSPKLTADDVAEIMYTSGTTGDPKGVVLTHKNIISNVQALSQLLQFDGQRESVLSILPLSHMLEQTAGFLLPFSIGAHIVYAHSHGAIRELLRKYRITKMIAVPEFLKVMAGRMQGMLHERKLDGLFNGLVKIASKVPFKSVQRFLLWPIHTGLGGKLDTVASGGAPLDPDLERWWDALGLYVLQGYGLTETSPVITMNTYKDRRIGSVGKPLPNLELRLGQDGEIEVRGPSIFHEYFKNEEKTKESFSEDGWFKTGDMGYFDADGFLYLKGRRKYMIKGPGAQNIFPEDIETILNTITGVMDSCVVGIEHANGMVDIHAVLLSADTSIDADSVIQQANDQLLSYQQITDWSVWPESDFPRSVTRKVKKELVITWIKEKHGGKSTQASANGTPLVKILAEIADVSTGAITPHTLLVRDLKFDSLMRVELVTRIEELSGVTLDERLITAKTTVADLEKLIESAPPLTKMPYVHEWPRSFVARLFRYIGQALMTLFSRLFFTVTVEGAEHLDHLPLPVVFMPNHVTMVDAWLVLLALPQRIRSRLSFAAAYDVLYEEYWYARWLAELFFNVFPFPRREHEHVATGLLNMGIMLDAGYSVVVFPEGHISKDGKLKPLKRGAGLIAIEMGSLVVPIKMTGHERVIPYNKLIPRGRTMVSIKIGKPIKIDRSISYDQATEMIEQALKSL
jgi:long-chain acyl-CoA synthetase